MKKRACLCLAMLLMAGVILASTTVQIDLVSRFIWRGFDNLYDNNSAIQPSLTFNIPHSDFALTVWSSFALTERNTLKDWDEIDLTLTYTFKTGRDVALAVGVTHYGWYFAPNFSFKANTTQEVFVNLCFPRVSITPGIAVYYDFNLWDGMYIQFYGSKTLQMDGIAPVFSFALGYNNHFRQLDSGISDLTFNLIFPLRLGQAWLKPGINYSHIFMQSVNPSRDEIWLGLSLIF